MVMFMLAQLAYLSYNLYYTETIINTTTICNCKGYLDSMVDNIADTGKSIYEIPIRSRLDSSLKAFY